MGGRGNGGNVARGAGFAAAKGAGLIGLAVVIGFVLLQVVDDGSEPAVEAEGNSDTTTTVPAAEGDDDDTTDTTAATAELTPDQLNVLVLNGSAPPGSAGSMSDALLQAGYTNQGEPSDWVDHEQTGNVVVCKEGLDREASSLAVAVGAGTLVEPFPDPVPPGSDESNCVVVVGAAAT